MDPNNPVTLTPPAITEDLQGGLVTPEQINALSIVNPQPSITATAGQDWQGSQTSGTDMWQAMNEAICHHPILAGLGIVGIYALFRGHGGKK